MSPEPQFLPEEVPRHWKPAAKHGFQPVGLYLGKRKNTFEVAVARSTEAPTRNALLETWRGRRDRRATPVLLVVLYPGGAALCGASGESPPVYPRVDRSQAERLSGELIGQPDRHASLRFLAQALPSLETDLPGINNAGLVSLHELQHGARDRSDWAEANDKASRVVGRRDQKLIDALGFRAEKIDSLTWLLRSSDRRTALAVLLDDSESPEAGAYRFNNLSPISYAMAKADSENLSWVLMIQGNRLRVYPTAVDAGVGRRGRTETYIECQPPLLADSDLAYLWLLYSAEALTPDGSISNILDGSYRFAGDLAVRLRERIYDEVVPTLAQGLATARNIENPSPRELAHTYEMALTVLFRLLFVAYAEDRDLLPYRFNEAYRRRSLKQKAQELADCVVSGAAISDGSSHWQEVSLLWQAVAEGNSEWGVPAYNGGLFSSDVMVSSAGNALASITLPNSYFEVALRALLVIETAEGVPGPVDFRSLGVREFGTIYEGLLESELAVATVDLAIDAGGAYVPVSKSADIEVAAGEVYLHNRSGVRKSSGSYYTKDFAVQHLLDGALEPALADHFSRLRSMEDDVDRAETFFDFRVADIAMGSGHFLIAAIDRIEKGMADFLANHSLPGVRKELEALREAAEEALGELAETTSIEDGQLLRRMIARRCIYGVDLTALSVQLARLSVWIHTFVPGLPLSFLDRTLVQGNSLVGIGTINEIRDKFAEDEGTLFEVNADKLLGDAAEPLNRLARINDATLGDISRARDAMHEAEETIWQVRGLCDLVTAVPVSEDERVSGFDFKDWEELSLEPAGEEAIAQARRDLEGLQPLHFPVAFPEVFLRSRPGFDLILGNPPWQEATIEEDAFWARHFPGLRSLPQRKQEAEKTRLRAERPDLLAEFESERSDAEKLRKALVGGAYPGMGTGDPDLYKGFCWRFWRLTAEDGGRIGVVLPRSALAAKGSSAFRQTMFEESSTVDVDMVLNRAGWVFDEAEHRYTIGLICVAHGDPSEESIRLRGPYPSLETFRHGTRKKPATFECGQVLKWNDSASLPLLPMENSVEVFAQIRKAPRLDLNEANQWRARPDRELDASNQKSLMDLESEDCPDGYWPVYKGKSFDIWNPDTGNYYAWADPEPVQEWLHKKRLRSGLSKRRNTAHGEFPKRHLENSATLPCFAPRVAFRDVSRATDTRTLRAALLPPSIFVGNQAPYLLWPRGDENDQAFVLGVLSSVPFDWYARRFVETHVNYFVFNPFPIPRPRPPREDVRWKRVVKLSGRLACPDARFDTWAELVSVNCGPLDPDEKEDMIHELDAVVAHLYGLNETQVVHIFETFHEGWDYSQRLDGVLRHYQAHAKRR